MLTHEALGSQLCRARAHSLMSAHRSAPSGSAAALGGVCVYPVLHAQVKDPTVLTHLDLVEHECVPRSHSLTSLHTAGSAAVVSSPTGHVHMKEPTVFMQVAGETQFCGAGRVTAVLHSSMNPHVS